MKRIAVVLLLLLASLACTLTETPGASRQALGAPVVEVPTGTLAQALVVSQRAITTPYPTPKPYYVVSVQSVNVRACPGVSCAVLDALSGGQVVTVLDTQEAFDGGTWSKIETRAGASGWVNSRFLEEKQP